MKQELKALARVVVLSIPAVRQVYNRRAFLHRAPACIGPFKSFAEAQAHVPPQSRIGFDHKGVADNLRGKTQFDDRDYPVLFWLSRIVPQVKRVFELGGSTGQGFFVYDRYLSFAPDLEWTVCDLPEIIRAGREAAAERNESRLHFTDRREDADGTELYATFGTLQYVEPPFAEILGKLANKPRHLLISRVPFTDRESFYALQNNGYYFAPYKLDNRADFLTSLQALGYKLVEEWRMIHPNSFLLPAGYSPPSYHGFYLTRG